MRSWVFQWLCNLNLSFQVESWEKDDEDKKRLLLLAIKPDWDGCLSTATCGNNLTLNRVRMMIMMMNSSSDDFTQYKVKKNRRIDWGGLRMKSEIFNFLNESTRRWKVSYFLCSVCRRNFKNPRNPRLLSSIQEEAQIQCILEFFLCVVNSCTFSSFSSSSPKKIMRWENPFNFFLLLCRFKLLLDSS